MCFRSFPLLHKTVMHVCSCMFNRTFNQMASGCLKKLKNHQQQNCDALCYKQELKKKTTTRISPAIQGYMRGRQMLAAVRQQLVHSLA